MKRTAAELLHDLAWLRISDWDQPHAPRATAGIDDVSFADFECRLTAMHTELDHYVFA